MICLFRDREFHPNWNKKDGVVNRVSYEGEYVVMENVPQNPVGRTGLKRRGKLGRWGPNHAGDPVITRYILLSSADSAD